MKEIESKSEDKKEGKGGEMREMKKAIALKMHKKKCKTIACVG